MAQRLLRGIATPTETLATAAIRAAGWEARFLELPETRRLFRSEQELPSAVIDRASLRAWEDAGRPDSARAGTGPGGGAAGGLRAAGARAVRGGRDGRAGPGRRGAVRARG